MTTRKKTGNVDGGAGKGVPMGGRDTGRGPTGDDPTRAAGKGDALIEDDDDAPLLGEEDVGDFFEDDDAADRRRDPLRRP